MCFGGGGQTPTLQTPPPVQTPPAPAPLPSPTPTRVEAQVTAGARRRRIANVRAGLLSTIKTSPRGIVSRGAGLAGDGVKKKKLGE